jgi:dynein intermediate chain
MDRKAELERKKAKLAALREEKDRRRREKELKDIEESTGRASFGAHDKENRRDLDEMLSSLGVAPVSEVLSSLSSVNSQASDLSANQTPDGSLQPQSLNGQSAGKNKSVKLSVVSVQATNIPPKETVTYTKQTQTTTSGGHERDAHATDYYVLTFGDAQGDDEENSLPHLDHGFHSKLPPGILPHGLPTVKEVAPAVTPQEHKKDEEKKEIK